MDFRAAVVANSEPAKLVQVTERAFDGPAMFAEPAAMFGIAFGQYGLDVSLTKLTTVGL